MIKTFSFIFLFLFLVSCNKSEPCNPQTSADGTQDQCSPDSTGQPVEGEGTSTTGGTSGGGTTGIVSGGTTGGIAGGTSGGTTGGTTGSGAVSEVPEAALRWDADVYMVNFTQAQEDKVNKAIELIKKVIASKEFRDRVINFSYNGKKQFVDNNGLTNTQIYNKILDGAEELKPEKNNTMDVELELYYQATSTIGYTYPDTVRIWMNTKYFNNYTAVDVTDNLTHEWLHKLGFDHAASYSTSRDYSVPYGIGYLMEELAAKYK